MTSINLDQFLGASIVGFTGSAGNVGFAGSVGYTGSQGNVGFTGSLGYTGSVGFTGSSGEYAAIGFTGSAGSSGSDGYTGSQGLLSWIQKTSNYTASANQAIIANSSSGSFTLTLPATPTIGDTVVICDGNSFSTEPITVLGNGNLIETYDAFVLNIDNVKVDFVYNGSQWHVFATITAAPTVSTGSSTGGLEQTFLLMGA